MKIVIAMDSFKGSMSSLEAGQAAREGILRGMPGAQVQVLPLADGGEGTVEALVAGLGGRLVQAEVTGPMGQPVTAAYGILPDGRTAVAEMSAAAGITLVGPEERDPLGATTYGVGELLLDAIGRGCRRFMLGIGGSATNDGGAGMLQALGFDLLDREGKAIPRGAGGLERLASIGTGHVAPELGECTFRVACDVTNPLCGPQGATAVFGPQKGVRPEDIPRVDRWLARYARLAKEAVPGADPDAPGTGAAGGLGFALRTFLRGELESGVRMVMEEIGLEEAVRQADWVVTGEGCLDGQTAMGKAPLGVAELAKRYGKPVVAFAGVVRPEAAACLERGIDAYFSIVPGAMALEEAMRPEIARENLSRAAEQVFRVAGL